MGAIRSSGLIRYGKAPAKIPVSESGYFTIFAGPVSGIWLGPEYLKG
jgi:hypothetical protein